MVITSEETGMRAAYCSECVELYPAHRARLMRLAGRPWIARTLSATWLRIMRSQGSFWHAIFPERRFRAKEVWETWSSMSWKTRAVRVIGWRREPAANRRYSSRFLGDEEQTAWRC